MALTLTRPVSPAEVAAVTTATRGMDEDAVLVVLDLLEYALRAEFGIEATDAEADAALRAAMLIGYDAFTQQRRNLSSESFNASGHSQTVARVGPSFESIDWPRAVYAILANVATVGRPATTCLVRD